MLLALLVALAPVVGQIAPAAAHDDLVGTEPAEGSTLADPPAEVALELSDDVLDVSALIVVTGPDGTPVTDGEVVVDGRSVSVALDPDVPDGTFTVAWRVVSADGHPVDGTFGYTVGAAAPSGADGTAAAATAGDDVGRPSWSAAPAVVAGVVVLLVVLVTSAGLLRSRRRRAPRPTSPHP